MFSSALSFRTRTVDKAALQAARHVLHLDCCHGPESVIAHGANALFAELGRLRPDLVVQHLRLWEDGTRARLDYDLQHVRAKMAMLGGTAGDEDFRRFAGIEELAAQASTAQGLVVSVPMWNYGAPWVLKQYFDCILHPGLTFRDATAGPEGLFGGGRPVVIITSSGGAAPKDHLTPWLLDVSAMMGFDCPSVVAAPNLAHSDRGLALDNIAHSAAAAASRFSSSAGAEGTSPCITATPAAAHAGGGAGPGAPPADTEEAEDVASWSHGELLNWLRAKGGLDEDALASVDASPLDGMLFCEVSEVDWREEELGLEDEAISRLLELQQAFRRLRGMGG